MNCLLILDMLEMVRSRLGTVYQGSNVDQVIPNTRRLVDAARASSVPIFFVCDMHRPTDQAYWDLSGYPRHALAGSDEGQVLAELQPVAASEVVRKRNLSGFHATDLDISLRGLGVTRVILAGLVTNGAVLHTAADAYQNYYQVVVAGDACSGKPGDEAHHMALGHIKEMLKGQILTSDEVIAAYLNNSISAEKGGTP